MIRVYISHSIRGKYGLDATLEQMEANNQRAIAFVDELKIKYSNIDFYCPGEHDEFVMIAYFKGYLTETEILDIDCEIVKRCNLLINFIPDGYISAGMLRENTEATKAGIEIINLPGISHCELLDRELDKLKG